MSRMRYKVNFQAEYKAKEPSLCNYLPIVGQKRTDGFMPFLRALAQSEMQTCSSRI